MEPMIPIGYRNDMDHVRWSVNRGPWDLALLASILYFLSMMI
jgi:hypothetical protein